MAERSKALAPFFYVCSRDSPGFKPSHDALGVDGGFGHGKQHPYLWCLPLSYDFWRLWNHLSLLIISHLEVGPRSPISNVSRTRAAFTDLAFSVAAPEISDAIQLSVIDSFFYNLHGLRTPISNRKKHHMATARVSKFSYADYR